MYSLLNIGTAVKCIRGRVEIIQGSTVLSVKMCVWCVCVCESVTELMYNAMAIMLYLYGKSRHLIENLSYLIIQTRHSESGGMICSALFKYQKYSYDDCVHSPEMLVRYGHVFALDTSCNSELTGKKTNVSFKNKHFNHGYKT